MTFLGASTTDFCGYFCLLRFVQDIGQFTDFFGVYTSRNTHMHVIICLIVGLACN